MFNQELFEKAKQYYFVNKLTLRQIEKIIKVGHSTIERWFKKNKKWREKVFKRDNYTCRICGEYGGKLNAHHSKSFSEYPKLRYRVKNGITLCEDCHKLTDNYLKYSKPPKDKKHEQLKVIL